MSERGTSHFVKRVVLDFVPHDTQRYETLGDWKHEKELGGATVLHIRISKMRTRASEIAVALHELAEALLCEMDDVTPELVDQWDFGFAEGQKAGVIPLESEPGNHPDAPYHDHHMIATRVEKEFLAASGVSWLEHETTCAEAPSFEAS